MNTPARYHEHIPILDILRGFAVCGIIFANMLVLSGYYFSPPAIQAELASLPIDQFLLSLTDIFVNYKFYTLFSFLFGVGFSVLLGRSQASPKHAFISKYLLRIVFLFLLGWLQALFIFIGDILRIYAVAAVFLLFAKDFSDEKLLKCAIVSFLIPLLIALCQTFQIFYLDLVSYIPSSREAAISAYQNGPWSAYIASNFTETLYYLGDNLTSRRFFKILGLFLLGFYVGRKRIFHQLHEIIIPIQRILPAAWLFSLSMNVASYFFRHDLNPFLSELLYALSVYPLTFTYVITIIYLCHHWHGGPVSNVFASLGRMSLTVYIFENILADVFMLWYGVGLNARVHISESYLIVCVILALLMVFSVVWLKFFKKGPIELLMQAFLRSFQNKL